ncbi:FAD-binding protein [Raoultibacter massiliensis]|uniref:FAD-binding protein n=1 Tax=Raoultibacter massiliensis TaxID=1852371 RepID=UPI003A914EFE
MGKFELSRRDFLKGAGITGAATAGALVFPSASMAFAEDGAGSEAAEAAGAANPYSNALGADATLLPLRKAECPGPRGPIAFEDREIADSEISSTEECEILIIGAGIGGLMGSLKAAEEGANVITLEKMTEGRSAWESFGAVGAKFQKEQNIEIDPAQLRDEIYRAADWRVDPGPIETYVNRSGEMADFWQDMLDKGGSGWELYKFDQAPNYNGFPVIDSYVNFRMPEGTSTTWLFGLYVCKELRKVAETYANLDMRYETPAVQLVREGDGRVSGAIAKSGDAYIRINASRGVLLATGGYDANPEMMQAWVRPEDYESSAWWNPSWGTTGDGHMMGLKIGADMDSLPHPVMNFSNATPSTFVEKRVYFPGAMNYSIIVNSDGNRFVNENQARQYISNAINMQIRRGKKCFHIFDQAMIASALEKEPSAEKQLERDEEKGHLFRASTLSELASMIGIDADALEGTVERYNGFFEEGLERDPDYYRYTGNNTPFTGGTYYALATNSVILATVGGLTINGDTQVLDTEGNAIEGLYATGNVSGNFYAGNYPRHIPGTSVGRAATFGYVAVEQMLKGGQE